MFVENVLKLIEPGILFQDVIFDCTPCFQIQLLLFIFGLFRTPSSAIGSFFHVFVIFHHIY